MSPHELTERLKAEAIRLGFDQVGIAPAVTPPGYPDFLRWLDAGHAAGMAYLERQEPSRSHPRAILDGVRSVVMVSVVYGPNERAEPRAGRSFDRGQGRALCPGPGLSPRDLGQVGALLDWLRSEVPEARGRAVVNTAPLLERDYARLAGLGWIGKNTMLISRWLGSFTFLGALLTDVELEPDQPHDSRHCGTCTRCLDACPTDAFAGPYELDARRCISYWTIEHRGPIPDPQAEQLDGWVFGCDICQDVCPWNRKAPSGRVAEFDPRPEWAEPDLVRWLDDGPEVWRDRLKGTALARAKRGGLLRNAALVLGTRGAVEAVGALAARLDDRGEDPVVRSAAAWALGRIATAQAQTALVRNQDDADDVVRTAVQKTCARRQDDDCWPPRIAADAGGGG